MHILFAVATGYLLVNFLCALLFHVHGLRQAHLRLRFLDVLMHFLLFTALAVPMLIVISAEAFFGREEGTADGFRPAARAHL